MTETTLDDFLNEFDVSPFEISLDEVKSFDSNNQFIEYGLPLLERLTKLLIGISNMAQPGDSKEGGYKKEDAILFGTLVRITKLLILIQNEFVKQRQEPINIFNRCLIESYINLEYFLKGNDSSRYMNFLKYSLREDKKLHISFSRKIAEKREAEHIEKRILASIERLFKATGFSIEEINKSSNWPSVNERIKKLGKTDDLYMIFGIGSHAIHGTWQDLYFHNLEYRDGLFYVKTEWTAPLFKDFIPATLIAGVTIIEFCEQRLS